MNRNSQHMEYYGRFQNGGSPYYKTEQGGASRQQHQQHHSSHHHRSGGRSYSFGPQQVENHYGIPRINYANGGFEPGPKSNLEVSRHRSPGRKGDSPPGAPPISELRVGSGAEYRGANTLPPKIPPGEIIVSSDRPDGPNVYPVFRTERTWTSGSWKPKAPKWDPVKAATDKVVRWKWIEWLSIAQIALGLCLVALGILRLALRTVVGTGMELAFGVYVVAIGIVGVVAAKQNNYCLVVAFFAMSALSAILAIAPLVTGLLVALPTSLLVQRVDGEPLGIDFVVVAVCILEMMVAIASCVIGCMLYGRLMKEWSAKRTREYMNAHGQSAIGSGIQSQIPAQAPTIAISPPPPVK